MTDINIIEDLEDLIDYVLTDIEVYLGLETDTLTIETLYKIEQELSQLMLWMTALKTLPQQLTNLRSGLVAKVAEYKAHLLSEYGLVESKIEEFYVMCITAVSMIVDEIENFIAGVVKPS